VSHSTTAGKEGTAQLRHIQPPYDGDSWWYEDAEYPDEGSVGPFITKDKAITHALAVYAEILDESGTLIGGEESAPSPPQTVNRGEASERGEG
jgi:hypothetical protein